MEFTTTKNSIQPPSNSILITLHQKPKPNALLLPTCHLELAQEAALHKNLDSFKANQPFATWFTISELNPAGKQKYRRKVP